MQVLQIFLSMTIVNLKVEYVCDIFFTDFFEGLSFHSQAICISYAQ